MLPAAASRCLQQCLHRLLVRGATAARVTPTVKRHHSLATSIERGGRGHRTGGRRCAIELDVVRIGRSLPTARSRAPRCVNWKRACVSPTTGVKEECSAAVHFGLPVPLRARKHRFASTCAGKKIACHRLLLCHRCLVWHTRIAHLHANALTPRVLDMYALGWQQDARCRLLAAGRGSAAQLCDAPCLMSTKSRR